MRERIHRSVHAGLYQRALGQWKWDFDTESTDICLREDEPESCMGVEGRARGDRKGAFIWGFTRERYAGVIEGNEHRS